MYYYLKKMVFVFLFASNLSYANIFYIKLSYGILSIQIHSESLFDAIDFDSESISFNEEVLFQLITDQFDDPMHLDFLAEEFLDFLNSTSNYESHIFLAGTNSHIEKIYFHTQASGYSIVEQHEGLTSVIAIQHDSSIYSEPLNSLSKASSGTFSGRRARQSCMFLCGVITSGRNNCEHYKKEHKTEYGQLIEKCKKGFVCPKCQNKRITSLQQLGLHIFHFHKGRGYNDFLH